MNSWEFSLLFFFNPLPANYQWNAGVSKENQGVSISTRLYLKTGITKTQEPEARFPNNEVPYIWLQNHEFHDLWEIDTNSLGNVAHITIEESFWQSMSGQTFAAGYYEADGFEVTIGQTHWNRRGSERAGFDDYRQDVFGRFDSIEIAKTFWQALTRGELLPTRPLCRELSLTEQAYAKQASMAVGLSTRISELEGTIAMMMNQLKAQGQLIQDHVLTPAK